MEGEQAPTHAAVLELRAERAVVEEAYQFLDEKRLLLAAELLQQLKAYEQLLAEIETKSRLARERLAAAIKRHGLQGLSVYPAAVIDEARLNTALRILMGVTLADTTLHMPQSAAAAPAPCNPSPEAESCREVFLELVRVSAALAGISGNLYRLYTAYRATERRARALENVILPDLETALNRMTVRLEESDLEDAVRARRRVPSQRRDKTP